MKKASDKWYFTKETNAKGLCYIYAYQTRWDPVTKKSKRSARKYVGRLSTPKAPFISAWIRPWSMRLPTVEISRTLPALNQRRPK